MYCTVVWRLGSPELRVIANNGDEQDYLEKHIGQNIEIQIIPGLSEPNNSVNFSDHYCWDCRRWYEGEKHDCVNPLRYIIK